MLPTQKNYEYLILGAGPAGLQLGYALARRNRSYVILEAGRSPGTFFRRYPRHRRMLSINKIHTGFDDPEINLRWDWNSLLCEDDAFRFTSYSRDYFPHADSYVRYLRDYADYFGLNVAYDSEVRAIERDSSFNAYDVAGRAWRGDALIVATGLSQPYVPDDIPGIELVERYSSVATNPKEFEGQTVVVIGKGNSAFETADSLIETAARIHMISPHPVRLAWKTHYVGDLRATNNNLLDTYQLKSQNTILDATIERIEPLPGGRRRIRFVYTHAQGQRWQLDVDRLVLCTGFQFDDSIFQTDSCRPAIEGRLPKMTREWESVNVPGLFFAGTLMQSRDYRRSFSAFIHGFRYAVQCLARILDRKYHRLPFAGESFALETGELVRRIIQRTNNASSLFQLPAFLSDIVVIDRSAGSAVYYYDLPFDFARDSEFSQSGPMLSLTLEYGESGPFEDPFNVERAPADGEASRFIHPVIRAIENGNVVGEYHIAEDLENEWDKPIYLDPFRDFVAKQLDEWLTRDAV